MEGMQNMSRRNFVKVFGLASGGLIIGCQFISENEIVRIDDGTTFTPNLFIQLKKDGKLILVCSRSEMGQGIRTSLTSAIADEMDADWKYVSVEQATGDKKFGNQNTDGSRSVRTILEPMRKMGATAKAILISAAAKRWQVSESDCTAENHYVINKNNDKKLFFGDLVEDAMQIDIPKDIKLKDKKDFKYIGKSLKSIDINHFTHGSAIYGLDARLPNMKFATVARCPSAFGTVKSVDKTNALKVAGVVDIIELEQVKKPFGMFGGVAVIATNTWAAIQGKNKLDITWNNGRNGKYDSKKYMQKITNRVHNKAKVVPPTTGNVNEAFSKASQIVEATYQLPHLAHAPMETPNALAWVHDGKCEVWAPLQDPQTARDDVAAYLGIDKENVTINVTFLGGGFGRKSKPDFVNEAVALSKKMNAPVQVVWTREDDVQNSYYHATDAQYLKASLDKNGTVTGWLHRTAFPSINSTFMPGVDYAAGWEIGQGMNNNPFEIENTRFENAKAEAYVRIGWLRSVCSVFHSFGINSFIDELADKAKKDPLQFKLDLIGKDRIRKENSPHPLNTKRLKNVMNIAAKKADWGRNLPKGHGLGIAFYYSFYSYVATVVEVSVINNKVKLHNIWTVLDCGMILNKDNVLNQMQGAAVFGTSIALYGKITAKDGAIEQSNFHDYKMARMNDIPPIDVTLVESDEAPTGVGEPGVPPIAPAIVNAIFNATGKRYRSLPLSDHGLV
ncbi:Membrane-bound aldehyde dehydrogenase [pyrroloquinoline-quinone] [Polaribacter huanghezhanensis]|uniref:xanthine dehydrogenase family protein molybdopterin-binding subunit n=1 Tax=Polaribacter huanghezhanensis TaxID=1354726 RepID=UPI0026476537|nr:molybdopterin cofactor-binding domain-containing protein [Polaribacter huanghezhanensis]WKD84814.1 Membrane-bound aldehyde dehydrogenase [pyrroloquinoline-quinone] [Polaribacter huanghezhanensis]